MTRHTVESLLQALSEQKEKCNEHINLTDIDEIEAKWWHRLNGLFNVERRSASIAAQAQDAGKSVKSAQSDEPESDSNESGCGKQCKAFGATYEDAVCINGYLWDLDSCDEPGGPLRHGGDIPCPACNADEHSRYLREEDDEYPVAYIETDKRGQRFLRWKNDTENDFEPLYNRLARVASAWSRQQVVTAVKDAMQATWTDWVADTGCYPDDIKKHKGGKLGFHAGGWAEHAGNWAFNNLRALSNPGSESSQLAESASGAQSDKSKLVRELLELEKDWRELIGHLTTDPVDAEDRTQACVYGRVADELVAILDRNAAQPDPERGYNDPSWPLHTRVEFALRDAGFELDEAANIAERVAQPAEPTAKQWREAITQLYGSEDSDLDTLEGIARQLAAQQGEAV